MVDEATDPVILEALDWFVRMRDHKVSASDRQAFQVWLAADAAHTAAWQHAEALWKRFDIAQSELDRLQRRRKPTRRHLLLGIGAALAGGGALYMASGFDLFADLATGVGERRTFTLADGSKVELGSHSALSVAFSDSGRQLSLLRGEGFFDVSADRRPFTVRAAGGSIRALGTRFDVKYVDDAVTVAVKEHAVAVEVGAWAVTIRAGWQARYDGAGLGALAPANLESVEAWRRDRLIFRDVPLRQVIAELDRYRRGRIVLTDRRIGDIPVSGTFDTRQADRALQTIADTLGLGLFQASPFATFVYTRG